MERVHAYLVGDCYDCQKRCEKHVWADVEDGIDWKLGNTSFKCCKCGQQIRRVIVDYERQRLLGVPQRDLSEYHCKHVGKSGVGAVTTRFL